MTHGPALRLYPKWISESIHQYGNATPKKNAFRFVSDNMSQLSPAPPNIPAAETPDQRGTRSHADSRAAPPNNKPM